MDKQTITDRIDFICPSVFNREPKTQIKWAKMQLWASILAIPTNGIKLCTVGNNKWILKNTIKKIVHTRAVSRFFNVQKFAFFVPKMVILAFVQIFIKKWGSVTCEPLLYLHFLTNFRESLEPFWRKKIWTDVQMGEII